MSFQLIYTSAERLLDSSVSGYGTVARSERLPKALCSRLSAISVYRESRHAANPREPQFSYHLLDYAGTTWHVLTCAQLAGADYSGRGCFIAHHLILSPEEVHHLLQSEWRPTPAGVSLALHKSGFWCKKWPGPPAHLSGEPELTLDDLPDAAAQPVWKRLTGHKANARAFFTPPFERDCLITVPAGTSSLDILHLLHESDWLTHTRGWGTSYTTVADEADSFAETLRMVTTPESHLVQRALRTGHPVLTIDEEMELPLPEPTREPPTSAPMHPGASARQPGSIMRTLSRSVSHYHYTEDPDWLMYDVKPTRPGLISGALITSGAAACLALGFWYYWDTSTGITPVEMPVASVTHSEAVDPMLALSDLIRNGYNYSESQQVLGMLSSLSAATVEDTLLRETATLILNSRRESISHPASIKRLCECARLLGMNGTELVRLYLQTATHDISPSEWQKQFDGQQLADWLMLKQSEPQLTMLLQAGELKDYAPVETVEPPRATILATAETTVEETDESASPAAPMGRISLIPAAAVSGNELPQALANIIPQLPLTITTGAYVVSAYASGGALQEPRRLELSPDGFHLYITPTDKPGEFMLKPEHKNGNPAPAPSSVFTVRGGRLQQVRSEEMDAVVCFPVPSREDFHTNTVLAASFGIPVPEGKGISLPPAAQVQLEITPDDLEINSARSGRAAPRIRLSKKDKFPWSLSRREVDYIRFSVTLPVVSGHNAMMATGENLRTYLWKGADIIKETDTLSSLRCELEHRPDLPGRLERAFDRVMNSPCCGEVDSRNQSMTLGHLYYICCALANDKLSRAEKRQLHQAYFSLFANKAFNKVLMRIFALDTALHLTPEEASSNKFKALQLRNKIKDMLGTRATRDLIRRRVCEVLTRTMHAAYTQERQSLAGSSASAPLLLLREITVGNHVELIWQFEIQHGAK